MVFTGVMAFFKYKKIAGMIIKYWKVILLIAIGLGIWWYHNNLINTIDELRVEVAQLQTDLVNCDSAITGQNNAIATLSASGKEAVDRVTQESSKKVAEIQSTLNIALDTIRSQPIAVSCESAIEGLIDSAHGELKWED